MVTEPVVKKTKWLVEPHVFLDEGLKIMNRSGTGSEETQEHRFKSLFGIPFSIVEILWSIIDPFNDNTLNGVEPKHLLWALMFLKLYGTEDNVVSLAGGCDDKTYRKWVWIMIINLSDLEQEVVSFIKVSF